jgi:hypothetical protein
VVELGAGFVSTGVLSEHYKLYSVEHDNNYVGRFEKANYIFAPEVNGWYDVEVLKKSLPAKEDQKLILIDGLNRMGILKHLDLFNPDALFIVHDTYRIQEFILARKLACRLNRRPKFYNQKHDGDSWASI